MCRMAICVWICMAGLIVGPAAAQVGQTEPGDENRPTRPTRPEGGQNVRAGLDLGPKLTVGDKAEYRISLDGEYLLSMPNYPLSDKTVDFSETRLFSETVKGTTQEGNFQIIGQYDRIMAMTMDRALSYTAADLPRISTIVTKTGSIAKSQLIGEPPLNLPIRSIERDPIYEIPFGLGQGGNPGATWTADVPIYVLADGDPPPKVKAKFTLVGMEKMGEWDVAEIDVHIDEAIPEAKFPLPGDKPGYGKAKVILDGTGWVRVADGRLTEEQFTMRYEAQGKVGEPSEELKEAEKEREKRGGRGGRDEGTQPTIEDPRPEFYASGTESRRVKLISATSAALKAAPETDQGKDVGKDAGGKPGDITIIIDEKEER
jgi:hypothetical protein